MIKSLTVVYVTARHKPETQWFHDSLFRELGGDYSNTDVIIVNTYAPGLLRSGSHLISTPPKPTIWQGEHRITKEDWWAKCNALNTGIALCDTEWIAFVDDRCVLAHGWLQCVQDSMIHGYAVCGSYEKRAGMGVSNGEIIWEGEFLGGDDRPQRGFPVPTKDWYGGSCAMPLEFALRVNGFPEWLNDGLGFEDVAFGILLRNNHLPMYYDSRMKIIEDRTPGEIGGALKRGSKPSPNEDKYQAKDYRILSIMNSSVNSGNPFDISKLREDVLRGEPFPPPCASHYDWFDNQPISEME
jgi:Glycosyl transferase family 2